MCRNRQQFCRQMHAVDCMRRLLSAIQTSLCTVSVSAAGAPWHKPSAPVLGSSFPMSCRNSQSLCREPRLPATLEANTLLPTPVQEQPGPRAPRPHITPASLAQPPPRMLQGQPGLLLRVHSGPGHLSQLHQWVQRRHAGRAGLQPLELGPVPERRPWLSIMYALCRPVV